MTYPYPYYADPYYTTWLSPTFPEHHHLFEHPRRRISQSFRHAMHSENTFITPHADVRETDRAYFIEIDIPGLESKAALKLKWAYCNTLLVEATTVRQAIDLALGGIDDGSAAQKQGDDDDDKTHNKEGAVHQLMKERTVGSYIRAFNFPCEIDRDAVVVSLKAGVVSLKVPKKIREVVDSTHGAVGG